MRALAFASLSPSGPEGEAVLRELPFVSSSAAPIVKRARQLISQRYADAPKVLDIFGGGGTLPYEAALIGAEVFSVDYNPLSVFIQKANLEFSYDALQQHSVGELATIVREAGVRILASLRSRTEDLFPLRRGGAIFAYYWSYRLSCVACGYAFLLMKRPWLSKKHGKRRILAVSPGAMNQSVTIEDRVDDRTAQTSVWQGRNGSACCPRCEHVHKNPSIREASDTLLAVGELGRRGKIFRAAPETSTPRMADLTLREAALLQTLDLVLPDSRLPKWSGIVNPALYGIVTHSDFLNPRQRIVLLELISALRDEHVHLQKHQSAHVTRFVIATLSALIDQLIDWNCRLSMWIAQNEQVGRAFSGPGVPMLWDYVETDPLLSGPANLWDKLDRIIAGVEATPQFAKRPTVRHGKAQSLPFADDTFDAILTDPPYYDNIYYNVLADFFYVWKRPLLEPVCPELFSGKQCDAEFELVASQFRQGDHQHAHAWYCEQLALALSEAARVLRTDGILSFVFSHSSLWGWEAVVKAFRGSGLRLTSASPLGIERRQRPRAMTSEAINTCIVFVARKSPGLARAPVDLAEIEQAISLNGFAMMPRLASLGWSAADVGIAVFAQGVLSLANASRESGGLSDDEALRNIGSFVRHVIPDFKLQARESL